jgi:hypothetical protein
LRFSSPNFAAVTVVFHDGLLGQSQFAVSRAFLVSHPPGENTALTRLKTHYAVIVFAASGWLAQREFSERSQFLISTANMLPSG